MRNIALMVAGSAVLAFGGAAAYAGMNYPQWQAKDALEDKGLQDIELRRNWVTPGLLAGCDLLINKQSVHFEAKTAEGKAVDGVVCTDGLFLRKVHFKNAP